jgi:diguanylate cyclase (GGDEF)-like protein
LNATLPPTKADRIEGMNERRAAPRNRTLLGAKIVFNSGRSAIDCTVRNLSDLGACLQVASPLGIPDTFYLIVGHESELRTCRVIWRSKDRIGAAFDFAELVGRPDDAKPERPEDVETKAIAFRAALDKVQFGLIVLDDELRAQFINRTFREMFHLPDAKADSKPPFVALMYHSRDRRAYQIPARDLDRYVAERIALVKAGDTHPIDIRLSNSEVIRFQCAVLPGGGRLLSYTYVTDIVQQADELNALRAALDQVRDGIILFDPDMNASFINRSAQQLWKITDEQMARHPNIAELVDHATKMGPYAVGPDELPSFIARRIAQIRAGDPTPIELRAGNGRIIRSQCAPLPSGGRLLTYCDVTDLVCNAEKMEQLATVDVTTGIANRRHFLSMAEKEWDRFQRYHHPLSMLVVDIDYFKSVNDRFGHDVGDAALTAVAKVLQAERRRSDLVGRFGGDEFVVLLPEADATQAAMVAERLCGAVRGQTISAEDQTFGVTLSIGVAAAALSMSSVTSLIKAADEALYEAKSKGRNGYAVAQPEVVAPTIAAE